MLTVSTITRLDDLLGYVGRALYRVAEWFSCKHDQAIINLAYRTVEARSADVQKARQSVWDLEDSIVDLNESYNDASVRLANRYNEMRQALAEAHDKRKDNLTTKLASAAEAVVAADKEYLAAREDCLNRLGVEV